jgi:predicted GIY-YIG superfamily endonuclease
MFRDGKRGFTKFRVPVIYDDETQMISQGTPVTESTKIGSWVGVATAQLSRAKHLAHLQTALYRFYNAQGRLLYVGIAWNPRKRFEQHSKKQTWWREVAMSETEIEWYPMRKLAKKAETVAIKTENPLYNKAENKNYRKQEAV